MGAHQFDERLPHPYGECMDQLWTSIIYMITHNLIKRVYATIHFLLFFLPRPVISSRLIYDQPHCLD